MMKMNQEIESISINTGNDDESFVILESSKNESSNSLMCDRSISWQPSLIQSTDYVSSPIESSQTHVQNQKFSICLSSMNMSPEDIQKKLHDVLKENVELKETLHQNNMAMKEQFSTLQTWQEEVLKVQKNHKEKFAETKTLILKLKADNQELRKGISGNMNLEKIKKLEEENNKLSTQITMLQEKLENQIQKEKRLFSQMQPSTKESELHKVVEQLTHQLEVAERARRQQTIDIERLTVQLSRTHNQLMSSQQQLTETQVTGSAVTNGKIDLDSRCQRYDQLIDQLSSTIKKEAERIVSMDTWIQMTLPSNNLQLEITELRKLLTEEQVQSVTRKENLNIALSSFQELLIDFKAVIQEMESLKEDIIAKEKHNKQYELIQKRTFREKIDSLTAQLVGKEEALAISERNLSSLQECIRLESENKLSYFSSIVIR
uniref:NF-kappa-B essential modulator NEMO N-terminal domain-containing protein n=1 Tax=Clastoptera arizonana TaxID=38151 RepID=A0A1B6CNQ6_9HEMI